jgi:hypothetical protein
MRTRSLSVERALCGGGESIASVGAPPTRSPPREEEQIPPGKKPARVPKKPAKPRDAVAGSVRCAGCTRNGSSHKAFARTQRNRGVPLCRECVAVGRAAGPVLRCAECTVQMALAIYAPCAASPAPGALPTVRLLCAGCASMHSAYASAHRQLLPRMGGLRSIDACKQINKVIGAPRCCPACSIDAKRGLRIVYASHLILTLLHFISCATAAAADARVAAGARTDPHPSNDRAHPLPPSLRPTPRPRSSADTMCAYVRSSCALRAAASRAFCARGSTQAWQWSPTASSR